MSATSTASFVQSLQKHGIVSSEQADQISRTLQQPFDDTRALASELVRRSHLTAFQADLVLQGRGRDLVVGPYCLLDRIGEGGMGEVFKARHLRMDRVVALKLIQKEQLAQPDAIERFFREARAAAQLSHPNIVIAHDAGQADKVHFLAMEYVEGVDLAKLVGQSGRLAIPLACDFIRQAALGLQHAFEKGVVHRDIKPGNLLVTRDAANGAAVVKILDFGLARFESETGPKRNLTQVGKIVGTVDYISPEQAENARKADIRSDIYSLGCSLFYLLTGQPPFPGDTGLERLSARLVGNVQPIRALRPEVPEGLELLLGKMLARHPANRFQTPAEVAAALKPFAKPGKVKAGALGSVSRKNAMADKGSGISSSSSSVAKSAGAIPFAAIPEESTSSPQRTSPGLVAAKPSAKAPGILGLMLGLTIGGGVAALVAVVLVVMLSRGNGDGKTDSKSIAQNQDGNTQAAKDQKSVSASTPETTTENNKKEGPKASDGPSDKVGSKIVPTGPDTKKASEQAAPKDRPLAPKKDAPKVAEKGDSGGRMLDKKGVEWQIGELCATLKGHTGPVGEVSFSPNGGRLASVGGNTVKLWDVTSGKELATQKGIIGPVKFSTDGRLLALTNVDYTLKVWDVLSGKDQASFKEVATLSGHKGSINKLSFSADGRQLVSASADRTVKLWDVTSGKELATLRPKAELFNVGISSDGQRVASAEMYSGPPPSIKLWDGTNSKELATMTGHTSHIYQLSFSPDGQRLASASYDRTVKLWDANTGKDLLTLGGHTGPITELQFSPDGWRLASAGFDKTVKIWDVASGKNLATLKGHENKVLCVSFSPDGQRLASASADETIKLWDVTSGSELATLEGHEHEVTCVCFSPDGKWLASGSVDKTVRIWNVSSGK